MSAISVRLPNSLQKNLKQLAAQEGISINQLIASAVAEKVSALMTQDYLKTRASQASEAGFEALLQNISNIEPEAQDRLRDQ